MKPFEWSNADLKALDIVIDYVDKTRPQGEERPVLQAVNRLAQIRAALDGNVEIVDRVKQDMTEFVHLRVLRFPCCQRQCCWISPRLPSHCPECGAQVYMDLKFKPENTLLSDEQAKITYKA